MGFPLDKLDIQKTVVDRDPGENKTSFIYPSTPAPKQPTIPTLI